MSTMRIFREILFVKQQMETADAREVKCLSHRLAELRGAHANAINADVLVEIFSWLLPPNLAYPSKYDAPLNVSHVCRAWRLVTLSNPILWSKFRLYGDADSEPAFPNQEDSIDNIFHPRFEAAVEAWDVWLVRSGSSPLGIEIYLDALQWSLDDYKRIIKILTMTLSHQKRWKHIKIDFPHKAHDVAFTMCDMPLLETLSIFVYAVRREGSTCGKLDVCLDLSCAPRLRELRMTQITCLKDPMPTLCNLRILAMSDDDCSDDDYFDHANLTWNVFIQTLRCAPQLQSIEDATLDVSDVRDAPEVILPLVREATFQLTERQPNAVYCALS
ncbi:hypothetical protein DFH11DRAFT_702743 [Phellopilus nigrolimitatus]|nr:hypothetical protein DFH11DRAFT_702743 [Phellopilus nigrolimitatus]